MNIDHIATVRNARGTTYPDPIRAALLAEQAGADLITLHLREDRRHIKDADVLAMRPELMTRMNLEAAVTQEMIDFACRVKPQDVCLVPERREEVTTEGGLDVVRYYKEVEAAVKQLQGEGMQTNHEHYGAMHALLAQMRARSRPPAARRARRRPAASACRRA